MYIDTFRRVLVPSDCYGAIDVDNFDSEGSDFAGFELVGRVLYQKSEGTRLPVGSCSAIA